MLQINCWTLATEIWTLVECKIMLCNEPVLPSFIGAGTIVRIVFGDVGVDAGQCQLLVWRCRYRLHNQLSVAVRRLFQLWSRSWCRWCREFLRKFLHDSFVLTAKLINLPYHWSCYCYVHYFVVNKSHDSCCDAGWWDKNWPPTWCRWATGTDSWCSSKHLPVQGSKSWVAGRRCLYSRPKSTSRRDRRSCGCFDPPNSQTVFEYLYLGNVMCIWKEKKNEIRGTWHVKLRLTRWANELLRYFFE